MLQEELGKKLSDIINQDGDIKNDGEVIDEIVQLLKKENMYFERNVLPLTEQTIVQKHSKNFETLKRVFNDNNAALMECTLKSTGEKVAVICAIVEDGEDYITTPFAMFFNSNPYELLEPPVMKD